MFKNYCIQYNSVPKRLFNNNTKKCKYKHTVPKHLTLRQVIMPLKSTNTLKAKKLIDHSICLSCLLTFSHVLLGVLNISQNHSIVK